MINTIYCTRFNEELKQGTYELSRDVILNGTSSAYSKWPDITLIGCLPGIPFIGHSNGHVRHNLAAYREAKACSGATMGIPGLRALSYVTMSHVYSADMSVHRSSKCNAMALRDHLRLARSRQDGETAYLMST